jgi:hypothetical protein
VFRAVHVDGRMLHQDESHLEWIGEFA